MEVSSISSHLINDHTICDTGLVTINSIGDAPSCIRDRLGVMILILQQQTRHMTTRGSVYVSPVLQILTKSIHKL